MSLFSDNIRQLRVKRYLSGKTGSKSFNTRGRYVKYEDGSSEPPYDILKRMSYYFHVSIYSRLTFRKFLLSLLKLGDNRILLPITVDQQGKTL
jgi:hypothetical protein